MFEWLQDGHAVVKKETENSIMSASEIDNLLSVLRIFISALQHKNERQHNFLSVFSGPLENTTQRLFGQKRN